MLIPWHTISVLAKCQSLKLECEHTLTKEVLAPPLDYSSQEISYRWVLPISPVRLKKNMNWHCQWGAKIISPMKAKHLALLPTPQLCHIMSLQCPDHTHFTPQSSLMTEKSFRNLMVSLTYIRHPSSCHSKADGDSRALHAPGAKWLNPVSQERRWCAERKVENHGLLLPNGPQLLLEDDEDFQLKHCCSQRSGTRAAEQVKETVSLSRSLIRRERKALCTQYSYWSYK